jgi:hypothetical protein
VAQRYGWTALFRIFVWLAVAAAVGLVPYALRRPRALSG